MKPVLVALVIVFATTLTMASTAITCNLPMVLPTMIGVTIVIDLTGRLCVRLTHDPLIDYISQL